jgi:signal transduction histidine kinase
MRLSTVEVLAGARVLGVVAGLCISAMPAYAAEDEARVLILNGLDPYLPAYQAIDSAMRASLAEQTARRIVLYSELLDAQRFAGESFEPEVVALLSKKYRALPINVVVTVTQPALDFYKRHGERLWPGSRLVAHGIADPGNVPVVLPPNAVGQINRDDVTGTIELARRLQPDARRILVISGVSPLDLELDGRVREVLTPVAGSLPVEFLSGVPLEVLLARAEAEPADTIILYLTQFRDREGRPYVPREVLRAISKVSAAPVYGLFETYVGSGVAAGSMEFYADRGRLVAQLVREAVAGKPIVPGQTLFSVPSRCVADGRALRRWSLDEEHLPISCDVRFIEAPVWRRYTWQIAGALGIFVGQTVLIVALVRQRRLRRIAEADSKVRFAEMAHMNRRVAMGELAASIAHELNQPLGAIYSNADAAHLMIGAVPPNLDEVAEILVDIKRDDKRASEVVARIRTMLRKSDVAAEEVDLNEAIAETINLLAFAASTHGVTVRTELEPDLPLVHADRVQIQQVIVNLMLNGMEAMREAREERQRLVIRSSRANEKEAEVSISDSGVGIPSEILPRIFDSFVSSKASGMGLGLSISRTIIEAHGGRIQAENLSAGGATFHFTVPFVHY